MKLKKLKERVKKKIHVKIPNDIDEEEKEKEKEKPFELEDINKYKLDDEGQKHDRVFRQACQIYAEKVRIKYDAELELQIVKDDLAQEIQENPKQWDLKKDERITDALINRVVVRDRRYQKAYKDYVRAKAQEKEWEGIKASLEQRGWMIKLLYAMWEKNYF